ncbi:MAG: hypothetical protein NC483_00085 [Ruminococcus sp.]|nr:hypothetical protein [Ruminococcus sp.]
MENLMQFNYDNKEYLIVKEEGKIKFKVNGGLDLTLEDRKVFNSVINGLIPKNETLVTEMKYRGKNYQIYKDDETNIYTFKPFNKEFLVEFNKTFNNQNEYAAFASVNKNSEFYKRFVKIGSRVTTVLLSVGLCLTLKASAKDIDKDVISIYDIQDAFAQELVLNDIKNEDLEVIIPDGITTGVIDSHESPTTNIPEGAGTWIVGEDGQPAFIPNSTENLTTIAPDGVTTGVVSDVPNTDGIFDQYGHLIPPTHLFDSRITSDRVVNLTALDIRDLIIEALESNENLSNEEKVIFISTHLYIGNNLEDIEIDECIEKIKTVKVTYEDGKDTKCEYDAENNTITFVGIKNVNEIRLRFSSDQIIISLLQSQKLIDKLPIADGLTTVAPDGVTTGVVSDVSNTDGIFDQYGHLIPPTHLFDERINENNRVVVLDAKDIHNLIVEALSTNKNLSDEERVWFVGHEDFIIKCHKEVDLDGYLTKLNTIKFTYGAKTKDVNCNYNSENNTINVEGVEGIKEVDKKFGWNHIMFEIAGNNEMLKILSVPDTNIPSYGGTWIIGEDGQPLFAPNTSGIFDKDGNLLPPEDNSMGRK